MSSISCVYCIKSLVDNKVYIGSTKNYTNRISNHKCKLSKNIHSNFRLQKAWNQYGEDNFKFECIEECAETELLDREQYWIDFYKSYDPNIGYNIAPQAGNNFGVKHNEETCKRISEKRIGSKWSEERKEQASIRMSGDGNHMFGKHHTEGAKEKMKYLSDGKLKSEAYHGFGNHFYGKKHSEETKQLISEKRSGKRTRMKLTVDEVCEIKRMLLEKSDDITYKSLYVEISNLYDVSASCIRKIHNGSRWGDITI